MRIAIVGVGAIGGYVGARLALAGEQVTFIARGANLDALRTRGLRLQSAAGAEESLPKCPNRPAAPGADMLISLAGMLHAAVLAVGDPFARLGEPCYAEVLVLAGLLTLRRRCMGGSHDAVTRGTSDTQPQVLRWK